MSEILLQLMVDALVSKNRETYEFFRKEFIEKHGEEEFSKMQKQAFKKISRGD